MKLVKSNLKKKALILLFLSFGMILTNLSFSPFLNNTYEEGKIIDYDDQNLLPKASDSLPSSNGVGDKVNISLHQSYLNNSFNIALNTSDSNNNEFILPSPKDPTFNSSYTYINVESIDAQNKTIEVETGTGRGQDITTDWSFSFEIPQSCILKNFSIALSDNTGVAGGSDISLRLYNASYNAGESRIEPDSNTLLVSEAQNIPNLSGPIWYDFIENVDSITQAINEPMISEAGRYNE